MTPQRKLDEPTDEELMERVRDGDLPLLSRIFDRHGERLFRYCWRMNQDRQLSEDLVQEAFLRMIRFRSSYRDGHSFQAWMYSIVRNLQMDHFRKKRFEADWEERFDAAAPPAGDLEGKQEAALLHQALAMLPPGKREILVMARFQEMPHEEIAVVLGCEVGSARVRLHRALSALREAYQELLRRRRPS
jgi:RNA polymerase sigma factor (sigma-70 family)